MKLKLKSPRWDWIGFYNQGKMKMGDLLEGFFHIPDCTEDPYHYLRIMFRFSHANLKGQCLDPESASTALKVCRTTPVVRGPRKPWQPCRLSRSSACDTLCIKNIDLRGPSFILSGGSCCCRSLRRHARPQRRSPQSPPWRTRPRTKRGSSA